MNLLEALFSGARALVREVVSIGRAAVREILKEVNKSSFGRAATKLVEGVTQKYFNTAQNLGMVCKTSACSPECETVTA